MKIEIMLTLNEETLREIKRYVKEEEGRCVKYAQQLFGLNVKPKISVKIPESADEFEVFKDFSMITPKEAIVSPFSVINDFNLRPPPEYDWDLRRSCIKHLSHEIGHKMQEAILGAEEMKKYTDLNHIGNNYQNTIFARGVFEAVAYYNENSTLKNYGIVDPLFIVKEAFDEIRLIQLKEAIKSASIMKQIPKQEISEQEVTSNIVTLLVFESHLVGRQYFEKELKKMKPKKFRKWVKVWRPETTRKQEKDEYLSYLNNKRAQILGLL